MSRELTQKVVECVEVAAVTMVDYDLRSAIGMARTSIEPGKKTSSIARSEHKGYGKRDDLAEELVEIIEGAKPADVITALSAARAKVNAPYMDPEMAGYRKAREKRGELVIVKKGSSKKEA